MRQLLNFHEWREGFLKASTNTTSVTNTLKNDHLSLAQQTDMPQHSVEKHCADNETDAQRNDTLQKDS